MLALLAVLPLGAGCELLDDLLDEFDYDPGCVGSGDAEQLAGTWRLTGQGSREDCDDSRFDGNFWIEAPLLDVSQTDDVRRAVLSLEDQITFSGGSFSFSGSVDGQCVAFQTVETGRSGNYTFDFDGEWNGGAIGGTFTATGPPGCASEGEFQVTVE